MVNNLPANQLLKGVNLYLIGMMGAGKTTIGRILAKELGYRFFDTDAVIEQLAGKSIREIFAESGEETFRQLETQVLAELSAYKQLAIATGGGIILRRENWGCLHHGIVVWLDVPLEVLHSRLQRDTSRPLLQNTNLLDELQTIFSQRQALYAQADVQITVTATQTANQVAASVLQALPARLKPQPTVLDPANN